MAIRHFYGFIIKSANAPDIRKAPEHLTPTAVILFHQLVVALHEARIVARYVMGLELIQRDIGYLHDHFESRAAVVVVVVHSHDDGMGSQLSSGLSLA